MRFKNFFQLKKALTSGIPIPCYLRDTLVESLASGKYNESERHAVL